jgi:hypothetical protein
LKRKPTSGTEIDAFDISSKIHATIWAHQQQYDAAFKKYKSNLQA